MRCPSCSHDNRAERRFCAECGAPLAARCASCGETNQPGEKFCGGCGAALTADTPPAPTRPPATATPTHLAEKILRSKSTLEGERKQVTVLFADVKGSMEMAERMDPEAWSEIMQRFFKILSDGVGRFEGFVDKFTGDGIMALFGAPIAHEDHARRACYAALHLLDELRRYANELRLRRGLNFSARLGLNSGEVIVGTIGKVGDDLRMEYTAQGHTVGLAARMEQIAEPGKVYLTAHTAAQVQGYFALADLGEMEVKGVQGAMHVYELQGLGQMRTRLDVSRSRGFSRFVGRGDEMQVLESALARAREGNAQIVGIVGEAGLGKSRLCYEFLERCRARGLMTYETTGVAHGKAIPFLPILRLFRAFYGITEQDSDATARERIAGRLLLLDERLRESLPLNFDFMGVPDPENPAPRVDPEARQRQMFDIVRRVIQARGQKETTVTLLEDLHWFDGGSAVFLEPLVDAGVGTRALVLLNFRPEYQAPWMGKSYYHQLALAPLGPDAIRELVDALLGNDPSTAGLAEMIHTRTAGNPFFTEEVVQNLIESGKLQGSKGAYRLVTPVDKLEVPSSVRALLAARIDRLAQRDKDVLQTAAVIGREFDEPTLAAVVEQDAPQLREALQTLKDTEFVYEQSLYPVAEYLFKHPLTQEVALASQLQERRRRLHAAVARVIEAAHAENLDRQAALLAHHWEEADEALTAARWHRRAAESAGRSDPTQGMHHMRRVLALTDGRDASDERDELRFDACRSLLAQGGWRLGLSSEEVEQLFAEGRELAARSGDVDQAIAMSLGYAIMLGVGGDVRRYHEISRAAVDLIGASASPGTAAIALVGMSYSSLCLGRIRDALEFAERLTSLVGGDASAGIETAGFSGLDWSIQIRAWYRASLGCLDDARTLVREAIRLARSRDPGDVLTWSLGVTVEIAAYSGDGEASPRAQEARRYALEAVDIAERIGSPFVRSGAYRRLGLAHVLHHDWHSATEALEAALALARQHHTGLETEALILAQLSRAYVGAKDIVRARALAEQSIERARAQGALFFEVDGQLALAQALRAEQGAGAGDAIERCLDRALELVRQTEGQVLEPQIIEERARLAALRADDTMAAAELRRAHDLYVEIGAEGHAERLAEEIGARG